MLTIEQKKKLAEWLGLKESPIKSNMFLSNGALIPFDPENDWNQIHELEEKMIKELNIGGIHIYRYTDRGIVTSVDVEYKQNFTGKKHTGSGSTRKEAILNAVLKHVEGK